MVVRLNNIIIILISTKISTSRRGVRVGAAAVESGGCKQIYPHVLWSGAEVHTHTHTHEYTTNAFVDGYNNNIIIIMRAI